MQPFACCLLLRELHECCVVFCRGDRGVRRDCTTFLGLSMLRDLLQYSLELLGVAPNTILHLQARILQLKVALLR